MLESIRAGDLPCGAFSVDKVTHSSTRQHTVGQGPVQSITVHPLKSMKERTRVTGSAGGRQLCGSAEGQFQGKLTEGQTADAQLRSTAGNG